jgi:hypothetical protein
MGVAQQLHKWSMASTPYHFTRYNEIFPEGHIALALLGIGAEPVMFEILDDQPRYTNNVEIEYGVLGY